MATFLRLKSKNKISENTKFGLTHIGFEFILTDTIVTWEWRLVFSEYIGDIIKEEILPTDFIGIEFSHSIFKGNVPFMAASKMTHGILDEHFEKIFCKKDTISGKILVKTTLNRIPEQH